ncbi:MAG TPA: hypothetical protein VN408_19980 [Actinoplanes sp.]|nr:hypothetical protein [Actinoplanes sp.]
MTTAEGHRGLRGGAGPAAVIGLLLAAGSVLVAAFVFAPAALLNGADPDLRDETALRDALGRGLAEYWRDGGPGFPELLAGLVDYWFRWHAVKVVISSLLVVVFVLLAVVLWRRYLRGEAGPAVGAAGTTGPVTGAVGRFGSAVGAVGATVFVVVAAGLLILNIQATAVPLVALLPLLAGGTSGGEPGRVLREMRDGLTDPAGPHAGSPVSAALLGEVERYHGVMVVVALTVTVAIGLAGVFLWRRRVGGDGTRGRFLRRTVGVVMGLTASLLLLVAAASASSAIEPAATLLAVLAPH